MGTFLSVQEFTALVGISERKARAALRTCHEGNLWRGVQLSVRLVSAKGGPKGLSYQVDIDSLPADLLRCSKRSQREVLPATAVATVSADVLPATPPQLPRSRASGDHREAMWKLQVIQPIQQRTRPGSPERAAMIDKASATPVLDWDGRQRTLGKSTIRDWIKRYEAKGLGGLMRKARTDAGRRRVILSRDWDRALLAAGVPEAELDAAAAKLRKRVRAEWGNGTPSWTTVQMNIRPTAVALTRQAGVDLPDAALHALCTVPRQLIEAERRYAVVATRRKDAAAFAADVVPRIRRDRSHLLPMEWVAADVHHVDIYFRRPDGSLCTPKMVAWMDLANNRVYADIFILPKGEMIRREHVIQSFVNMCTAPDWGVPSRLYVDHGGEYNWAELADDLAKLKHTVNLHVGEDPAAALGAQRAKPYNPQAKVIESLFAAVERVAFAQLPGYVGGNRMRKKTQNQGKEPVPYPGGEAAIKKAIATALAYYHGKALSGQFKGQSPGGRFAGQVAAGWHSTVLDPWELAVAFSREVIRKVDTGGALHLDGKNFRADALQTYVGRPVLVRQPLFGDRNTLFVFTEFGEPLAVAHPETVYAFGDLSGAGEQARRMAALKADIAELDAEAGHLDGEATMAEVAALAAPGPAVQSDGVIRLAPQFGEMARMARAQPKPGAKDSKLVQRREKAALLARLAATG